MVTKFFRVDHNHFGGGLILYINEDIPFKPIQEHLSLPNFEVIATEFYQNNQKWPPLGLYKPPRIKNKRLYSKFELNFRSFLKTI